MKVQMCEFQVSNGEEEQSKVPCFSLLYLEVLKHLGEVRFPE